METELREALVVWVLRYCLQQRAVCCRADDVGTIIRHWGAMTTDTKRRVLHEIREHLAKHSNLFANIEQIVEGIWQQHLTPVHPDDIIGNP